MLQHAVTATFARLRDPALLAVITAVLGLSVLYKHALHASNRVADRPDDIGLMVILAGLAVASAVAIWGRAYHYDEIWRPLRILVRGVGVGLFIQIAFDAFHPSAIVSNLFLGTYLDARILIGAALVAGGVAMFRPAFLLPMLLAYVWFRRRAPGVFGLGTPTLDFTTLADVGLFPISGLLLWRAAKALDGRVPLPLVSNPVAGLQFQKLMWGLCVGVHLGNYFHSAIAKIQVGGRDRLFWLFNNPTEQSVAVGLFRGNGPLAGWPELLNLYHQGLAQFAIPINVGVLALQLLAPLSVVNRRVLILFTVAFDLMHIGIFGSLGAFFFFWILLNLLILASLEAMKESEFSTPVKLTAMVAAVFGYLSFSTAHLGWLDGRKVVRVVFVAHRPGMPDVRLPPAAFGLFSYQLGHADLYIPAGHFPVRFGGNVFDRKDWPDALTCGRLTVGQQPFMTSVEPVGHLIAAVDAHYRRHPWAKAWLYLYPHHEPSNPSHYPGFDAFQFKDVASYSYIVESGCPAVVNGRLKSNVKVRTEYRFDA